MASLPTDDAVRAAARRLHDGLAAAGLDRAVAAYFSEPEFAGMTFSDLGRNPPDEITADDLLAVSLLDITWRPQVVRVLLGSGRDRWSQMLAAIPQATDLWDATDDVLRCLLQDPAARAEVEALRPEAAAGATLVRILDVALWVSHGSTAQARWVREKAGMASGQRAEVAAG